MDDLNPYQSPQSPSSAGGSAWVFVLLGVSAVPSGAIAGFITCYGMAIVAGTMNAAFAADWFALILGVLVGSSVMVGMLYHAVRGYQAPPLLKE